MNIFNLIRVRTKKIFFFPYRPDLLGKVVTNFSESLFTRWRTDTGTLYNEIQYELDRGQSYNASFLRTYQEYLQHSLNQVAGFVEKLDAGEQQRGREGKSVVQPAPVSFINMTRDR